MLKGLLDLGSFDHVSDRGLHVDDARRIQDDQERSLGQVIDGCQDRDHCGLDRGLHVDDARGIQEMKKSCQTEDGCRVLKSTKTMEILWYCKHFLDR